MAGAREWYDRHGRPWVYLRQVELQVADDGLRLNGVEFRSRRLQEHLRQHAAVGAVVFAVSAGAEGEAHARQAWDEARPDEYYFLETYASAVVEDLVARCSGRICDLAGQGGLMAVPHYSPGYSGWDVAEQPRLFEVIAHGMTRPFPGPLEVLASGMLRPKKSLLAVCGLAPSKGGIPTAPAQTPCENCAFSPCNFRRAPYRPAVEAASVSAGRAVPVPGPLTPAARYTTSTRALRKWAEERVRIHRRGDHTVEAVFRFDGTTCSNQGRPLAFDYRVSLSGPEQGYRILEADCVPAAGDDGYQFTCAYLADSDRHMQDLATRSPLLGQPLDAILTWTRASAPSGCHCTADSRVHKWGLAFEAIHYALVQTPAPLPLS
jgi:hypothetical protein